jgi:molybdenum cofactor guanylyltransferase
MSKRAAIVLSGGKAERFQGKTQMWQDKALVELLGKPLLIHAIESVANYVDETIVVVNDQNRLEQYAEVLANHGVTDARLVTDVTTNHLGGPLVAIYTGLKSAKSDHCLTLPSDMPLLQPQVIEHMFSRAKNSRVVVPMWPNGRLETLVMVLQRASTLKIAETLYSLKRPRSDDIIRGALKVLFLSVVDEIQKLDPEIKSFVNINAPGDLAALQPRRAQGNLTTSVQLDLGDLPTMELHCLRIAAASTNSNRLSEASEIFASTGANLESKKLFFWAAISLENQGKALKQRIQSQRATAQTAEAHKAFLKAARNYELEADMHEKNHYPFLAERARSDKQWCVSRAKELTIR